MKLIQLFGELLLAYSVTPMCNNENNPVIWRPSIGIHFICTEGFYANYSGNFYKKNCWNPCNDSPTGDLSNDVKFYPSPTPGFGWTVPLKMKENGWPA